MANPCIPKINGIAGNQEIACVLRQVCTLLGSQANCVDALWTVVDIPANSTYFSYKNSTFRLSELQSIVFAPDVPGTFIIRLTGMQDATTPGFPSTAALATIYVVDPGPR